MLRALCLPLTAVAVLSAGLAAAAPVTAQSSGAAFNLSFIVDGSASTLLNQVYSAGTAPPAYNVKKSQATFSHVKTYPNHLTVTTTGSNLSSTAASTGLNSAGGIKVTASATVVKASSTVKTTTFTDVSFNGANMSSSASYSVTKAGAGTVTGSAKVGSMTLSAPFFKVPTIKYSGTPTPNKVLYKSADGTVIVYVNHQVVTQLGANKTGITVNAVDMVVKNYAVGPYKVNGELAMGTSIAQK